MLRLRFAAPLLAVALLTGCDSRDPGSDPPIEPNPPPSQEEVVAGVNLTRLFAAPTSAERDSVREAWALRAALRPERYAYEEVARGDGPEGEQVVVFAGRLALEPGAPVAHYALVRLPPRAPGDVRPLPVLFVSPRQRAASLGDLFLDSDDLLLPDETAQILVTWRGGSLAALGRTFAPDLAPSPYDADADDALAAAAALPITEGIPFTLDFERSAWVGRGRGGTVALLAGARGAQLDAVAAWAAPTSFFVESVRDDVRRTLRGGDPSDLPGLDPVYRDAIFPIRGDSARLADARIALLTRSPLPFAGALPPTLLVHSPLDRVVPFDHATALGDVLPRPEPFGISLYSFPESQNAPGHAATFADGPARRTAARFLAYHLGLE